MIVKIIISVFLLNCICFFSVHSHPWRKAVAGDTRPVGMAVADTPPSPAVGHTARWAWTLAPPTTPRPQQPRMMPNPAAREPLPALHLLPKPRHRSNICTFSAGTLNVAGSLCATAGRQRGAVGGASVSSLFAEKNKRQIIIWLIFKLCLKKRPFVLTRQGVDESDKIVASPTFGFSGNISSFFFFFLWPFFLRDSSLSPNFFSGWSETRFFCFDLESFFLVLLRLGQLTELNADHPINPCSRGGLPFQTSNRTKVVWTFTATDVSIHRTPVKGKKNNKIIKTTNFTKINSCFGWITGGQNILATKWYRQTGTDPSAWAPLVHFALFGWFDLLLLAASTPFGSPSIWSSFPSYGHQVAVLLLLMPNCPLPPSLSPVTSLSSCWVFSKASSSCHSVCYKSCVSSLLRTRRGFSCWNALKWWKFYYLWTSSCPHSLGYYSLKSLWIMRRKKAVESFFLFLVLPGLATTPPQKRHPSRCEVTLVGSSYPPRISFHFFFFFGLDWMLILA